MWETRHSTVDWIHFKTQTLLTTLKTRNQPQEESCVSLEAEHLFCKLDVQEAKIWLAQFHRVWDNFSRCWTTCGWVTCYWSLGHSDWGTTFNQQHCPTQPYWHRGNSCETQFQSQDQKKTKEGRRLINCQMWIMYPLTHTFFSRWVSVVHFWRQWSYHQNDYQRTESDDETCVKNPQSCAWLVVRPNQFGTQDPNQICWHHKPTRRHFNLRKLFTWRMGSSSSFVQHYEFLDVLL